jgi:hypothetical protein
MAMVVSGTFMFNAKEFIRPGSCMAINSSKCVHIIILADDTLTFNHKMNLQNENLGQNKQSLRTGQILISHQPLGPPLPSHPL